MTGFEYVHVMVDDPTRLAYAEVLPRTTARCAIGFLRRAIAYFADHGIHVEALMSDNGSAYSLTPIAHALAELGLRHLRIRPYRPRTNGKAERFIQTLINEWAYERVYGSSPSERPAYRSSSTATTSTGRTARSAANRPRRDYQRRQELQLGRRPPEPERQHQGHQLSL